MKLSNNINTYLPRVGIAAGLLCVAIGILFLNAGSSEVQSTPELQKKAAVGAVWFTIGIVLLVTVLITAVVNRIPVDKKAVSAQSFTRTPGKNKRPADTVLELIRIKEKEFPDLEHPEKYTEAKIWHCNYHSLAKLSTLENLEVLKIAGFPDDNLDCLSGLQNLQELQILHLPNVTNLDPLARLHKLKTLELSTLPGWDASGQNTVVESFAPLAALKELENLVLASVVPEDENITVLSACKKLRWFRSGNHYPVEQLAGLKAALPKLEGSFLTPLVPLPRAFCKQCGEQKVMLSGVVKYALKCPNCNAERVREHLAQWEAVSQSAVK